MEASNIPVLDAVAGRNDNGNGMNSPRIHVSLPTNLKIVRSPSRDSVATEFSLCSLSSCQSDFWKLPGASSHLNFLKTVPEGHGINGQQLSCLTPNRGPSPIPGGCSRFLKVPSVGAAHGSTDGTVWWEEETDFNVIKSCIALSKALGLQKSFSTGDIASLNQTTSGESARLCVSEVALNHIQQYERLPCGMGSRSLSTWVAVGDGGLIQGISSQLPSPQGRPTSVLVDNPKSDVASFGGVSFTPADLILSVNKQVRQHYIRRRLLATYKALERLSQSQFNLDKMAAQVGQEMESSTNEIQVDSKSDAPKSSSSTSEPAWMKNASVTLNDVERERGRPLSKYQRNIMIFNWLHSLEDTESDLF